MRKVAYFISSFLVIILLITVYSKIKYIRYTKYQTFDEYKLQGVMSSDIISPYVLVKREKNMITVVKSDGDDIRKYIKKGSYWYSYAQKQDKRSYAELLGKHYKSERPIYISQKYIFKDTIVDYVTVLDEEKTKISDQINIKTKNSIACLIFNNDKNLNYKLDLYNVLVNYARNYKKLLPYYLTDSDQQAYYQFYNKRISGNTLYYNETTKSMPDNFTVDLNSLGEYNLPIGFY